MSYISIGKNDSRYETLKKGFNQRWPSDGADASAIYVCRSVDDAQQALQHAVAAGLRPTIRSGGHCYEGFVSNNPGGVIIDVGFLTELSVDENTYRIGAASSGNPGWPLLAFCTMSTDRKRMVLMHCWSRSSAMRVTCE